MAAKRKERNVVVVPRQVAGPPRWKQPLVLALAAVAAVLVLSAEERTYGTSTDEQQMLGTAVALATSGEIGIARGQLFTIHRPGGDAVSPYGMGQPLVTVLPALLAPSWERRFGAGSSQTLFVLLQVVLVAGAAAASGLLARRLASEQAAAVAVVAAALGSPLWAYTSTGTSEALQAVVLAAALVASAAAVRGEANRALALAAGAGLAAGLAVLTKPVNLAVAPFALVPLLLDARAGTAPSRPRLALAGVLGSLPPLLAWLAFEVVRFGRPLASYGDQRFSNSPLGGLVQLLLGPSKGLLWYFPLLPLAVAGTALLVRSRETRGTGVAIAGISGALLVTSASWWAWDGTLGWGPRLLVPALPLLAAGAAPLLARGAGLTRAGLALVALGVAVNALGVLQGEAGVSYLVSLAPPAPASPGELRRLPASYLEAAPDGGKLVPRELAASGDPAFSPLRLHPFVLAARMGGSGPEAITARLSMPPWLSRHPEARPDFRSGSGATASLRAYLLSRPRMPVLFSACGKEGHEDAAAFNTAWGNALADQVLRQIDVGRPEAALPLAETLVSVSPSGYTAALEAEALRALGRLETARSFLDSLPPSFRSSPSLAVVDALVLRDAGDAEGARQLLAEVAKAYRRPGVVEAAGRPVAEWPRTLHEMTGSRPAAPAPAR